MSQESQANAEGVDFALVAYREEGVWQLERLDHDVAADHGAGGVEDDRPDGYVGRGQCRARLIEGRTHRAGPPVRPDHPPATGVTATC